MSTGTSPYIRPGRGRVPASPLISAAWKELIEEPGTNATGASAAGLGSQLDFTVGGLEFERFRDFFQEALQRAQKVEAIVEAGNKYSVSAHFPKLNGELLLHDIRHSAVYQAMSEADRARADKFCSFVCLSNDLRNRNPLHPNPLDSAVIGNLLNFPKHIFGFPHGGYATDGNEGLSLLLFAYRVEAKKPQPRVIYVLADGEAQPAPDIQACALRLRMQFEVVSNAALSTAAVDPAGVVVMCDFDNPSLAQVLARAQPPSPSRERRSMRARAP